MTEYTLVWKKELWSLEYTCAILWLGLFYQIACRTFSMENVWRAKCWRRPIHEKMARSDIGKNKLTFIFISIIYFYVWIFFGCVDVDHHLIVISSHIWILANTLYSIQRLFDFDTSNSNFLKTKTRRAPHMVHPDIYSTLINFGERTVFVLI